MKCSVFIATSADGYIANLQGDVDWLHSAGNPDADMRDNPDMGFNAYIDGGATITSFLNLKLIDEMTITRAPILLGDGIPLFGKLDNQVRLVDSEATAFANDFIQVKYRVNYL